MPTRRDELRARTAPAEKPAAVERPNPFEGSARIVEAFARGKDDRTAALRARIAFAIRHQPRPDDDGSASGREADPQRIS